MTFYYLFKFPAPIVDSNRTTKMFIISDTQFFAYILQIYLKITLVPVLTENSGDTVVEYFSKMMMKLLFVTWEFLPFF